MLVNHPAIACLRQGIAELHLHVGQPDSLALELVHFLFVKRWSGAAGGASRLSPSAAVDQLWHWMLLNRPAKTAVHSLVRGCLTTQSACC